MKNDTQYEIMLDAILTKGKLKEDRTGTGTLSLFGYELRYKLWENIPVVTTKEVHLKSIVTELLWFIRGESNATWLQERGCKIWDAWAEPEDVFKDIKLENPERVELAAELSKTTTSDIRNKLSFMSEEQGHSWLTSHDVPTHKKVLVNKKGDLGPVYGKQWRAWPASDGKSIDQLKRVLDDLNHNPDSRRIIISAWNVSELDKMALAPCHALFQFYSETLSVAERKERMGFGIGTKAYLKDATELDLDNLGIPKRALSCKLFQRSADVFLGVPFNIASYSILVAMVAQQTNHLLGDFIWSGGDCHIYTNHIEQCKLQLTRTPYPFPKIQLNKANSIDAYTNDDIKFLDYVHHPKIIGKVSK